MQAVYTLGPLVIGMSAGDTKYLQNYNNDELISGRTDKYCNTTSDGSLDINHGVLVVGYQESTVLANGTAIGGSFIIKNSWGIAWGLAGQSHTLALVEAFCVTLYEIHQQLESDTRLAHFCFTLYSAQQTSSKTKMTGDQLATSTKGRSA